VGAAKFASASALLASLLLQMRSTPLLNSSRTRKENLPFGARHKRFVSAVCMPLVQVKVANLSAARIVAFLAQVSLLGFPLWTNRGRLLP
jgi:hypothetical protein